MTIEMARSIIDGKLAELEYEYKDSALDFNLPYIGALKIALKCMDIYAVSIYGWQLPEKRLPDKRVKVLVQTQNDRLDVAEFGGYGKTHCTRMGEEWDEEHPIWYYPMGGVSSEHPKAWMPLPKPYGGDRE